MYKTRRITKLALFSPFVLIGLTAAQKFPVPLTPSEVMIDGVLSPGEWKDAKRIDFPGIAEIYFQGSKEFVYVAIQYTHAHSGIVDLFLSPRPGEIYDLHVSAKLGERELRGKTFPDWEWWNNRDWIANVSRVDSFESRSFKPAPIREYQIRRSRFPSPEWRVCFELTAMETNNEMKPMAIFPKGAASTSRAEWIVLVFK